MSYQITDRPHASCLPPRRQLDPAPSVLSLDEAERRLAKARRDLAAEGEPGWRWHNPCLAASAQAEIDALTEALDEWKATLADMEQTTLERARLELSQLHPDHGGPGGDQFTAAVKRMKRAKKSTGDQPHA